MGGVFAALETGYMKRSLVESSAARLGAIAAGEQKMVGVNCYTETAPSPLTADAEGGFQDIEATAEAEQIERLRAHRESRDEAAVHAALDDLRAAATEGRNVMPASIACAHAGVTTGEWGHVLRDVFGEYRAPTGVGITSSPVSRSPDLDGIRKRVDEVSMRLGRRLKILVGKPGLDGHSNGAEQVAVAARDCGFEVVYEGIRLTPSRIVNAALEEGVHVVGLSILSGAHRRLVSEIMRELRDAGLGDLPVVLGGIIPHTDEAELRAAGVARIFTPKDFALDAVISEIVELVEGQLPQAA
jgi:(2R)-ethylmalonyl-CoA mutase